MLITICTLCQYFVCIISKLTEILTKIVKKPNEVYPQFPAKTGIKAVWPLPGNTGISALSESLGKTGVTA